MIKIRMSKILEKLLKDAIKEDAVTVGTRQVQSSADDSKLIVLSKSVDGQMLEDIESHAKKNNIPLVRFAGTSVALGKLCGKQFRISALSFTSLVDANVPSILKEAEEAK